MSDQSAEPLTLAKLDDRLREVEALQQLILRLMAITKPLDSVLEQFGATDTQQRAIYRLLDELVTRHRSGNERDRPTFPYFQMRVDEILPSLRGDRQFIGLLIDTLRIERAAYRELHEYMVSEGWPAWS